MNVSMKNLRTIIYHALFFITGSILTLSFVQIENNCTADLVKQENFKYYKVAKWQNPPLVILIISSPQNLDRRTAIRETWLTLQNKRNVKIKHFFVIGSVLLNTDSMLHLSSEQSKYSDLLILPIKDKYSTLTHKVLQSFIWLHEQLSYGLNFTFVLKCDDDTFIRTDLLQQDIKNFLPKYSTNFDPNYKLHLNLNKSIFSLQSADGANLDKPKNLYWGYFNGNANIKTKGKWKENDWILCDHYLPYALGGGYILSRGLVSYLAKNNEDLKLFKSEDVSVGTWLSPVSNIDRLHDIRFNTEWNSRGCLNTYVIYHKISIDEMRKMYQNIKNTGSPCIEENVRRKYYLYNWTVEPSKCCGNVVN